MDYLMIIQAALIILRAAIASSEEDHTEVAILKQVNRVNDDGSYTFGYEAADGSFKIETRDVKGNVKGMFGYIDSTGELKKVSYASSNNTGFQTTDSSDISGSTGDTFLSGFSTPPTASDRSDRKPVLVLRDSALNPTKASFIQYIPKKSESPTTSISTPAHENQPENDNLFLQDEDLFVNPDASDTDKKPADTGRTQNILQNFPRKIVVTRRPVDDDKNNLDYSSVSRGGNALRRQLSRRLNEREDDGVHVYGNEVMNSNYYDKPMDAHTILQGNIDLSKHAINYQAIADKADQYEILEPKYREHRAGYALLRPPMEDIDRTLVYANQNVLNPNPVATVPYRPRTPPPEPEDYRTNYPVPQSPYPPYSSSIIQSLRDELMEYILHYVHRRLSPYFQDSYSQSPYYRNPTVNYGANYPFSQTNYPIRGVPPQLPYNVPLEPGVVPYTVHNFPFMNPNVQYSTQSPGSQDTVEKEQEPPKVKLLHGRPGYIRRPYPPPLREIRDRRQPYPFPIRTKVSSTTRESPTIQASASTTSSTTVVPSSTPVRNIQILGTTPSPATALSDSRPVTESTDEMEATS